MDKNQGYSILKAVMLENGRGFALGHAEDYQRRYHVFEIEQAPDKETYKYYSTQRPIDIGTYPNSYFNRPVHMDLYFTRVVPGVGSHHLCPSPDRAGNAGL